ncbi:Predicted arabinose efflux permease, MFS family [Sinosporangium album]|uniref:Predicted arabinose efflux permease, MFS family n=1 Tax=Sinosporangium album TaxID=504805 RepID=A0A1G7ZSL7_9ACTN|nr:MFS transporter [Sinosporangium album]SDH11689.1 Predicted arabinose efflux permease, MFS family [Sinosporangium album]
MAGLGRNFTKLWAASTVSNIGDGIATAAAPLLIASITTDPVLVGMAMFVQQLPWLLFSLISGVYVDRLDRRTLIVVVNTLRALIIGGVAVAVWQDAATIPVIYAANFLLGTCETLGDNASATLIPAVVKDQDLPRANARMQTALVTVQRFAAPPSGAALFVLAAALPFAVNAATFVLAAGLVLLMRGVRQAPPPPAERRSVRADMAEGIRWLWGHRTIRLIAVSLLLMNITLMSGLSILVLYSRERLGLNEYGYGAFLTVTAAGGLIGALLAPRLQARFSDSLLLRIGLVIETLTHVGLALATTVWVAGPVMFAFGVHGAVLGAVTTTMRQRAVPERLRGRVQSVYLTFVFGGNALGALIGGPIAGWTGLTGPFWMSAAAMAVFTVFAWRPFGRHLARPASPRPAPDEVPAQR